ncbi:MAG: hypothetical protein A2Y12_06130 [Planctomycetes bacterium GWF2_42_9]|nr:MAG: hypothetical protein A2Y12_06130 [Planctomycetes bacterium GWF2_42_9]HAL45691.1 hypothetical protein [Phycisphaerales bacterium]
MENELLHIKAFIAESEKAIDEENKSILFSIPEVVDRDNEIVTAQAIYDAIHDKKNFAPNPACLPCHDHKLSSGKPPCVGHWDIESATLLKNSVEMKLLFAWDTELGGEYWKVYSKRHMRAVSIGFHTLEWKMEDRKGVQVKIITKIILYEISCVAVGCNPGALSKLKSMFGWNEKQNDEAQEVIKQIVAKEIEKQLSDLRAEVEDMKLMVMPDSDEFAEKMLGDNSDPFASQAKEKDSEQALVKILNSINQCKQVLGVKTNGN